MKLFVLDNGRIEMTGRNEVTVGEENVNDEVPYIPIHSFLIQCEAGNILFDTGCDPMALQGIWPDWLNINPFKMNETQHIVNQVERTGIKKEEVDYIIMSHLHMDHAGGLYLFPNTPTYVHEDELECVLYNYSTKALDGTFHVLTDVEHFLGAKMLWRPVVHNERETKICNGVTILNLGAGHSFGMLAVLLEMEEENIILAADAVYSKTHFGPPALMAGICHDEKGYFEAIEIVREYAEKYNAKVLFGHDKEQFASLKKAPEYYR